MWRSFCPCVAIYQQWHTLMLLAWVMPWILSARKHNNEGTGSVRVVAADKSISASDSRRTTEVFGKSALLETRNKVFPKRTKFSEGSDHAACRQVLTDHVKRVKQRKMRNISEAIKQMVLFRLTRTARQCYTFHDQALQKSRSERSTIDLSIWIETGNICANAHNFSSSMVWNQEF